MYPLLLFALAFRDDGGPQRSTIMALPGQPGYNQASGFSAAPFSGCFCRHFGLQFVFLNADLQTKTAFLENVLGFIRVIADVMQRIAVMLPEILG